MVSKTDLEQILPWNADPLIAFFENAQRRYVYREQLIELILESRHAFLAECPRASMIVAGEALLRTLYELVATSARQGHEASVHRGKKKGMFTISPNMNPDQFFALHDELTFDQTIRLLIDSGIINGCLDAVYAVKGIRNQAAHCDLPLITDWDPDEPREKKAFIFDESFEFPEAYSVVYDKQKNRILNFDLRLHECGSFRPLGPNMSVAAIQYLTVMEIISSLSKCRG